MSNATAARTALALQVTARINDTLTAMATTISDAARAHATENLIDKARTSKTSVSKLSTRVVKAIIETAIAEADNSDIEGVDDEPIADVIELRPAAQEVKAPRVRGSHEGCTHEAGKVARAKCRRERARNA